MSIDFLQTLIIQRMLQSIELLKGKEIPAGQRPQLLSASLDDATFSVDPTTAARLIQDASVPFRIGFALNADLTVTVKVFIKGDNKKLISTLTIIATGLVVRGAYANNILSFEGMDFPPPQTTIKRDPNADQRLRDAGIDPLEAARVEGLIAYSAVNHAISSSLAQRRDISLSDVFPAFDFGTAARLVPLASGRSLGIIPSAFTRVETAACACSSGPNLSSSGSTSTISIPPNPKAGTPIGSANIGGPLPQKIDPLKDLGIRFVGSGKAGVYLPKVGYDGLTLQAMPAIQIHASDDGFIGFDAYATVAFANMSVSLDAKNGGIIVAVSLNITVQAICTLDIGCGIRLPIGEALIQPDVGSNANLQMGFYPAVDSSGTVKLKAVLQSVDMGKYVAIVIGVGAALEILGVTAWAGFLIDVVLSAVVSNKLPDALTDEVKKYLGQNEWVLLSFGDLLKTTYPRDTELSAPFDVDVDTLLASISSRNP
jgi:hypothetical protein